jgi:hypothetical protein
VTPLASQVDTELWIRVFFEDQSYPTALWCLEKFMNRLYLMREQYQASRAATFYRSVEVPTRNRRFCRASLRHSLRRAAVCTRCTTATTT